MAQRVNQRHTIGMKKKSFLRTNYYSTIIQHTLKHLELTMTQLQKDRQMDGCYQVHYLPASRCYVYSPQVVWSIRINADQ